MTGALQPPPSCKQVPQRATIAHLKVIINLWGLFRCSRAANSTVSGPIWLKIELTQILCMSSLHASLKSIGSIATDKKWKHQFLRHPRAAYSLVSRQIWPKFKLIQALKHVFITCKYQLTKKQNSRDTIFPIISLWGYIFRLSRADNSIVDGPIWPKFELLLYIMHVLDT